MSDGAATPAVTGIVLAAGAGRRFGGPKAQAVVGGERLLDHAIQALVTAGCQEILAVVRAGTAVAGATPVINPDPDRGLSSSLKLGLAAAHGDIAVIVPVDVPGLRAEDVDRVAAAASTGAGVAVATYQGRRGHPVAIARAHWPEVAAQASGDEGARRFLAARPDLVVEVAGTGDPSDIDTAEDLARWESR